MLKWYELKEGIRFAFSSIKANKMRSVLTTLGVVIGIVTVTLMATVIEGLDRALKNSVQALGSDVIYVSKWDWFSDTYWKARNRKIITLDQAQKLKERMTTAAAVVPSAGTWQRTVKFGSNSVKCNIEGTTEEYMKVTGVVPERGRFFNALEVEHARPVCVLGYDVADKLFPNLDPIGRTVKISGKTFRVIGVWEKEGDMLGSSFFSKDSQVYIPLLVHLKMYGSRQSIEIAVKAADPDNKLETKIELIGIFRKIRHVKPGQDNDFGINEQDFLTKTFDSVVNVIAIIGFIITSLSLLVGGVGIMNIMFVSVKERTREIGIRKAIGAKRRTILGQFLIEAATICTMGGLIGLGLSFVSSLIINEVLPSVMPLWVVVLSITISVAIGLIAGFLPAFTAARLDPVDALRYE